MDQDLDEASHRTAVTRCGDEVKEHGGATLQLEPKQKSYTRNVTRFEWTELELNKKIYPCKRILSTRMQVFLSSVFAPV